MVNRQGYCIISVSDNRQKEISITNREMFFLDGVKPKAKLGPSARSPYLRAAAVPSLK